MNGTKILNCFAIFLIALTTQAQESTSKIFVKLYGGYAFLGPGSFTGINKTEGGKFETSKDKFGQGLRAGIGAGYIVNENINIGVDVVYHKGKELNLRELVENFKDTISAGYITTLNNDVTTSYTHTILNIIPNITFKAISKPSYYVYNRVGLIVAFPLNLNVTTEGLYTFHTLNTDANYEYLTTRTTFSDANYSQDPAFGFQAALGVQFVLSKNLRFFAELEASSLVLIPKELIYTSYDVTTSNRKIKPTSTIYPPTSDKRLRNYYYQKSGVLKTVYGTDRIDSYTFQTKLATNSLTGNIGIAFRF